MKKFSLTSILAIISITTIEVIALLNDINGATMAISLTAVSGLGGYAIARSATMSDRLDLLARKLHKRPPRHKKR